LLYPLKFVEPSIVSAVTLAITPIATLLVATYLYKKQKSNPIDYGISITLLALSIYLILISFSGKTLVKPTTHIENIFSVICYLIVGIALAFNNIYAKRLSDANFSPIDTLTIRFLLLVILTGILCLFFSQEVVFTLWIIGGVFLCAFSLIIIPQIVYQISIRELQPISIAITLPFMPVLVFFLEFFDHRVQPQNYTIAGILAIFLIVVSGTIVRYRKEKSKKVYIQSDSNEREKKDISLFERIIAAGINAGYVHKHETDSWLRDLSVASIEGTFLYTISTVSVMGIKEN